MTRVDRTVYARHVPDDIPGLMIANMGRLPAGIPVQKEAGPPMMMHGLYLAGRRHGYFQDPNELILENNSMAVGRHRDGVIAFRETRRVICGKRQDLSSANGDQEGDRGADCYSGA